MHGNLFKSDLCAHIERVYVIFYLNVSDQFHFQVYLHIYDIFLSICCCLMFNAFISYSTHRGIKKAHKTKHMPT